MGNIPKAWDKEELEKVLGEQGPGIQSVELLKVLDPFSSIVYSVALVVSTVMIRVAVMVRSLM